MGALSRKSLTGDSEFVTDSQWKTVAEASTGDGDFSYLPVVTVRD